MIKISLALAIVLVLQGCSPTPIQSTDISLDLTIDETAFTIQAYESSVDTEVIHQPLEQLKQNLKDYAQTFGWHTVLLEKRLEIITEKQPYGNFVVRMKGPDRSAVNTKNMTATLMQNGETLALSRFTGSAKLLQKPATGWGNCVILRTDRRLNLNQPFDIYVYKGSGEVVSSYIYWPVQ